ncbi:MAG: septal ring lytic transglycosylase RlpA family protein [Rhodocyclaceae bacterium]|nr:septal ring lytic transglycosylase RlpA family protein [Rhodocyclaceae bacterium]MBX3668231.1 septal ring lytic transglycosylase RlpA family protein [Rhodocyclaceae bacterium]
MRRRRYECPAAAPLTLRAAALTGACALLLAACTATPSRRSESPPGRAPAGSEARPTAGARQGGYYLDDGPGDNPPSAEFLAAIPDATPQVEPLHRFANRPYTVMGQDFVPRTQVGEFRQSGRASWYGRRFHGQKTASGETYDMYGMSAAHPTLPIPSYVRVTSRASGRAVVVRINDRGPFLNGRICDLSYTAAYKLGLIGQGSGDVELEAIVPGSTLLAAAGASTASAAPPAYRRAAGPGASAAPVAAAGAPQAGDAPDEIELLALADAQQAEVESRGAAPGEPLLPEMQSAAGTYLQLGAFAARSNAESFRQHLSRELDWLAERILLTAGGGKYRVQVGPYRSRAAADEIAGRIRESLNLQPMLITR